MSSEWKEFRIGDLCNVTSSKRIFAHDYVENGIPFYRSKDIIDKALGTFSNIDIFISEKRFTDIAEKFGFPEEGDLLLSSVGNRSGVPYVIQKEGKFYFKDGNLTWFKNFKNLSSSFLFYWLKSDDGQNALHSIMIGSAQKALTISGLSELKIKIPNLQSQISIVSLLRSLDDRITLLRETNKTLEAIAQAIFKSWFVDFDPVRAKQEGREPEGMDADTAALFPDSFEDSELGLIPKGWRYCSFQDAVTIFDSKRVPLSGQDRAKRQGQYPYYGAAALMDHVDDFLFDGVYFLMGEDGSVVDAEGHPITQYVWGKFWVNNHAHILQGKNGVCTEHAMIFAKQTNIQPYITGAVQAKLSQSNMWRIPFLMPRKAISESFGELIAPLYNRLRHNSDKAQTLAQIRDTLLPRLISGQLRLPEAEELVSEATS